MRSNYLTKLEFFSFLGLALSLPLFESAKNVFLLLCVVAFFYRFFVFPRTLHNSALSKYILFFCVLSVIASLGAMYRDYDVKKLHDVLRCTLIGYIFVRSPLSKSTMYWLLAAFIFSALIASLYAYYSILVEDKTLFELNSVGHINHSSIYLLLIVGLMLPFFIGNLAVFKRSISKILFVGVSLALTLILFDTDSRATFIGFWMVLILVIILDYVTNKKINIVLVLFTVVFITWSLVSPLEVVNKFSVRASQAAQYETGLTPRERIWYTAVSIWKKEALFGIGFGNFSIITPQKMDELYLNDVINKPESYKLLYGSNHAHNRYVNTLVEGGVVGFLGLLVFLFGSAYILLQNFKHAFKRPSPQNTIFWLIGANALMVVSVVGLCNTTLHHEHGVLAMILIAIHCNYYSQHNSRNTLHSDVPLETDVHSHFLKETEIAYDSLQLKKAR